MAVNILKMGGRFNFRAAITKELQFDYEQLKDQQGQPI
jgi:hypothetical protein